MENIDLLCEKSIELYKGSVVNRFKSFEMNYYNLKGCFEYLINNPEKGYKMLSTKYLKALDESALPLHKYSSNYVALDTNSRCLKASRELEIEMLAIEEEKNL